MFVNPILNFADQKELDFRKKDHHLSSSSSSASSQQFSPQEDEQRRMLREKIPDKKECVFSYQMYWTTKPLSTRHYDKLVSLAEYFTSEKIEKLVVPIIGVRSVISLRALDFFVINIARVQKTTLQFNDQIISIYECYRSFLRHQTRGLFDAFRRGTRLYFDFGGWTYSTTIGQLNYLMWAEKTGILHFAYLHIPEIEKAMNLRIVQCKQEKAALYEKGVKRVRSNLALGSNVSCQIFRAPVLISFSLTDPKSANVVQMSLTKEM